MTLAATTSGQGPAVVLLHGQPGSARDWAAVTPLLSTDLTVIAVDRPGYGGTEGPAGDFAANAGAVVATLDHLGIRRAVMVGHSWAGGVALTLAADHPERVSGLVLVASIGPDDAPRLVDRLLAAPVLGDVVVASAFTVARNLLASAAVRAGLGRVVPAASGLAAWRSFMVEQRVFVDQVAELADLLARITARCLVVVGSADRVVSPKVGAHLVAAIPGARLRTVAGAGHLLPFDHPHAVADAVRSVSGGHAMPEAGGTSPPWTPSP